MAILYLALRWQAAHPAVFIQPAQALAKLAVARAAWVATWVTTASAEWKRAESAGATIVRAK